MTFAILTANTHKIIARSEVRTAADPSTANLCANDWGDSTDNRQGNIHKRMDQIDMNHLMAIMDVDNFVGRTFQMPDDNGILQPATIIEAIKNQDNDVNDSSVLTQFQVQQNNDKFEEILAYNQLMGHIERDTDVFWDLEGVIAHQGPLNQSHLNYKGSKWNVAVLWKNGEKTDEPLNIIGADSPVACAICADKNNPLDQPGWQRFKKIAKVQKKLVFESNKAKIRNQYFKPKYKCSVEVPRDY